MSPSAFITTRVTKSGKRFVVRYRTGGRETPLVHAGSFRTQKDARARRDLCIAELAAGRDPCETLRTLRAGPTVERTYRETAEAFLRSRHDVEDSTIGVMRSHLTRLLPPFGDRDPRTISVAENIELVADFSRELKPASIHRYFATHRLILDFADVDPNPARDRRVKLPSIVTEEPQPPTGKQFARLLEAMRERSRLIAVTMEQTAMAVGETVALAWGDVDVAGCQFRLRRSTVKAKIRARARWVQVPEWLMALIADTCPLEDRTTDRRVFRGLDAQMVKRDIVRASRDAGLPHFHPHDLRHRRLTIWHHEGVPAKVLAERAGHSRASISLDVYSHVQPPGEADIDSLKRLLVRSR